MNFIFLSIFSLMFGTSCPNDMLTGRWETKVSPKGNVTGVVFKADNTLEGYINRKPFVSGKYSFLSDSTITMLDNGCEGKPAISKVIIFSNGDSLRLLPIEDPCAVPATLIYLET